MSDFWMQLVKEFHETFGHPVLTTPTIPATSDGMLRVDLIREEFEEFEEAAQNADIVGVADALGDLAYVICGAAHAYGIDLDEVVREIHRSNMTKRWPDGQVRRRADGKILKGPNYVPPQIKALLDPVAAWAER